MSIYEKGSDGEEVARVKLIDSGVGSAQTVGLRDSADARIDPATEQKQDTANALLTQIEANQPVSPRLEDGHGSDVADPSFVTVVGDVQAAFPSDERFVRNSSNDGALPSGPSYTIPAVPAGTPPSNVIDSGWIERTPGRHFASNYVKGDQPLKLFILNSQDLNGTLPSGTVFPSLENAPGSSEFASAPFFEKYVRYVLVNDSGSTANDWSVDCREHSEQTNGVVFTLDAPLFNNIPAPVVKTVPSSPLDFFENVGFPIQLEAEDQQTVLLDLATIDPTDFGFPAGTPLKYVALAFDVTAINTAYFEGRYAISDAGDAQIRMAVPRRSPGRGVGDASTVYVPQARPEFVNTVQLDFAAGAGRVAVTGRIDGYLTANF